MKATATTVTESIQRNKDIKPFYTSRELAGLLNISDSTLWKYHAKGYKGFPHGMKVGQQWRWNPKDIDAWIENYNNVKAETQQASKPVPLDIFVGETHTAYKVEPEKKKKPVCIEDFAPEMFDLLSRIAQACKGKKVKQDAEITEIDTFIKKVMGIID